MNDLIIKIKFAPHKNVSTASNGKKKYNIDTTAYNITKTYLFKQIENFQIKNLDIFHISVQNLDCGYSLEPPQRSNKYPQSMFSIKNKKQLYILLYNPINPSFTI